nr:hypothetical protein Iba_chr14eCG10820 [Ipomoea batatas]
MHQSNSPSLDFHRSSPNSNSSLPHSQPIPQVADAPTEQHLRRHLPLRSLLLPETDLGLYPGVSEFAEYGVCVSWFYRTKNWASKNGVLHLSSWRSMVVMMLMGLLLVLSIIYVYVVGGEVYV